MESPLQDQRHCPACPSGIIAPTDLHLLCFECLGMEHAIAQRANFFSGQTLLALSPDASDEEEREYGEDAMEEEDAAPTHTTTIPEEASLTRPASTFLPS
ncbi:Hypothetical predicted protein [Scomber scombrus]|uniref:Uncharacterized protein n=1 Tax=Scomber scombrus TaxID=13677 RepID=A0AAV1P828_SCOSC